MEQTKKHFLKNMVGFSMTAWISFVVGFIASPIATRLFVPAELGKVNLFNTYSSLFVSLCYLGLDQAFVRFFRDPPSRSSKAGMLAFCTATSLGFGLLTIGVMLLHWQGISALVIQEADFSIFLCLGLFGMCSIWFRYLSLSYRMEQNAKLYTLQGVVHIVLTKIAYLAVGFGSAKGKDAILLLTLLMGLFTLAFVLLQRKDFDWRFLSRVDKPFAREMASFSVPLIPIALIAALNSAVSPVMLNQLMGADAVGIFTSALGLASTVNIVQTGFNTYWAPYVYENYQTNNKRRFFTVHRIMACALTLFGLGITLLQGPVFLLLGRDYRSSVIYFPFLFLSPICYCLSETTGMGIGISKKTYWNSVIFFASVVVNLGLCFLLIPTLGGLGAALAAAAAAIVSLLWRTWAGERYYKAIEDYRYVGYSLALMLAASLGNWLLHESPLLKYVLLLAVLALACFLFRREIRMLWQTALQVVKEGKQALTRKMSPVPTKEEEDQP